VTSDYPSSQTDLDNDERMTGIYRSGGLTHNSISEPGMDGTKLVISHMA
jgi:hypothetical protein